MEQPYTIVIGEKGIDECTIEGPDGFKLKAQTLPNKSAVRFYYLSEDWKPEIAEKNAAKPDLSRDVPCRVTPALVTPLRKTLAGGAILGSKGPMMISIFNDTVRGWDPNLSSDSIWVFGLYPRPGKNDKYSWSTSSSSSGQHTLQLRKNGEHKVIWELSPSDSKATGTSSTAETTLVLKPTGEGGLLDLLGDQDPDSPQETRTTEIKKLIIRLIVSACIAWARFSKINAVGRASTQSSCGSTSIPMCLDLEGVD
ncbi:hypothetical protein DFP72DRAFT_844561 [Ephemerocybe angulata]|uniref:Uncharacterized protein n=1 Tax=Ephemerocybe angulata TaxID=980116 RepID=A0A8H6HAE4_9AGAR|nr:hypothetical protein DFP72DRAFT_1082408 [Tulosesus angulatus]KAF6759298.1 hypothetical protein DFP72DRAFT_844561 [Tulosesus angulatus]